TVTPKLNGVAGPAFQVIKDSLTLGLNALTLTDVTKNAAYGVEPPRESWRLNSLRKR
ncbi:hypothetical protein MMR71_28190, partial [Escherichia coli]|nr:hypothetical protein [Escherichia coli]